MCGRFIITSPAEAMADLFGTTNPLPNVRPRYNAAPTQRVPVALADPDTKARHLETLRWGLVPFWAESAKGGYNMINAMGETVAQKPAFRAAFKARRCLIPADGFYEWKKLGPKEKQPYAIVMKDRGTFAFAGDVDRQGKRRGRQIVLHRHHDAERGLCAHP
jgi:putative SOS response-associated peptidase YedK